jgi:hypothetical protein
MRYKYLMSKKNNHTGVADLPDWLDFDEQPPRSFDMWHDQLKQMVNSNTSFWVVIPKEVYDIMRGV